MQETTAIILTKIEQLLAMESQLSTSGERQQYLDLQSLLCNMLSVRLLILREKLLTETFCAVGACTHGAGRCGEDSTALHERDHADDSTLG